MTEEPQAVSGGLFESLKTLSVSLLGIVHTRLDLLSNDVAEEREQLTSFLLLVLAAVGFLGLGIVLLVILIVVAFWETHRLEALAGLTGLFLMAGIGLGWYAMHRIRTKPRLFEASLTELSKDRQQLRSGS
ncbi:MAG: phage holin family protein [Sulfuriferula multivorans]|uniref:Phage holin family protein n=1 Tax=Sulfuriferula multivorans TaxID=1559896 RepID=A0A7C9NZC9_9PROT|nr:phage holin family protein [Sulfuriferula multivorans]